jgi:hypothetical protein
MPVFTLGREEGGPSAQRSRSHATVETGRELVAALA